MLAAVSGLDFRVYGLANNLRTVSPPTAMSPARSAMFNVDSSRPVSANCVEKLRLIEAPCADSLLSGAGDSVDDGRTADDAGGAVLRLQP